VDSDRGGWQAEAYYEQAWDIWQRLDLSADPAAARLGKDLGREITAWLLATQKWDPLAAFVAALPDVEGLLRKDQVGKRASSTRSSPCCNLQVTLTAMHAC
jgi:hypothetical protein